MINFNILIIESIIYIVVSIIIGILLRDKDLKRVKRLILLFYLIIGIAIYSVLYFIILSVVVLLSVFIVLKVYE